MKIQTRIKIARFFNVLRSRVHFVYEFLIFFISLYLTIRRLIQGDNGIKNDSQHFLPQLLQRGFQINDTNKKGWVYVYTRGNSKPEPRAIRSVGQVSNFYITRNRFTKKWENTYDELYKFLEDAVAPTIFKLKATNSLSINIREENILAEFIASLYTRTPVFRTQVKHIILFLIEQRGMKIEDLGKRKTFENIFINNSLKIDWQEAQNFVPLNTLDILNAPNHLISISSLVWEQINEQLFRKNICILESDKNFILSDSPVVVVDFKNPLKWPLKWDFSQRELAIALPISPKRCIAYGIPGTDLKIIRDELLTDIINSCSFYFAHEFVISNINSNLTATYFNGTKKLHAYSNE